MKTHLRRNTAESAALKGAVAACATDPYQSKSRRNSRSTYQNIPQSKIVDHHTFRQLPEAERCAHCCDAFLIIINRQNRAQGKALVSNPFTMELAS